MTDESTASGATPSGSDPASGATPGGQGTGSGATPEAGSKEGATPDTSLGDTGRVALDNERNARRDAERQLAETRRRINELEDAGKSDGERTQARLARANADLETATRKNAELEAQIAKRDLDVLKMEVATEAKLPPFMAQRLQGDDLRSLRADAKKISDELAASSTGSLGLGQGGGAVSGGRRVDMNTLIREAAGRQ